tara:strand:- start:7859 stop:9781 length:1923 start_codon:yes stop_codon:yes gene_type:complete
VNGGPSIIGFRKDRIGARLIGLLNILRLGRKFDTQARFLWLAEPDGPYPELVDPNDFLQADFVARHIGIVSRKPNLDARTNLTAISPIVDAAQFSRNLAEGQRFHSDAAFEAVTFMGEDVAAARAEIAAIAKTLPLARRLKAELRSARAKLEAWGGSLEEASAIHLRRGDLLDGEPWSLSSWPEKYVPDEFCLAWTDATEGPVIVFSDTPGAAAHLAAAHERIVPVDRLLDLGALKPAERDVLEVMLMAGCAHIGAPGGSAFSRAAAAMGSARLIALPRELPDAVRLQASQHLLERVIGRPGSFYASGDLAQSAQFAASHADATGQGMVLATALSSRPDDIRRHPFLRRIVALSALHAGDDALAARAARAAMADPRILPRDRKLCQQALDLIAARKAPDDPASADAFLGWLFSLKTSEAGLRDAFARLYIGRDCPVSRMLMIAPKLAKSLAARDPAAGSAVAPGWSYLCDWEELLKDEAARQGMRRWPELPQKMAFLDLRPEPPEAALKAGKAPPDPGPDRAAWLGLAAAILSLHGRYARALRLLHWLDRVRPGEVLTRKRLADTCWRLGNVGAAEEFLADAIALCPDNPLLHLSMARRAAALGRAGQALDALERAEAIWPDRASLRWQGRVLRRKLADP